MENLELLKRLLLQEEENDSERMETSPKTFEDDPMNFILDKYDNLKEIMSELMSDDFKELLTGIYILAYKPSTFKILLHNGQFFFMTFMGEAYQATVSGKNYFLLYHNRYWFFTWIWCVCRKCGHIYNTKTGVDR